MTNEYPAGSSVLGAAEIWQPDVLGDGYEYRTLNLGSDPDGEGEIVATLVRHLPDSGATGRVDPGTSRSAGPGTAGSGATGTAAAVLYLHGFTDYFFQRHVAAHLAARGHRFYALDLRKCGRSLRPGQTPHFIGDLALYDRELNEALRLIADETQGNVLVMGHSTGGLVAALWLDRLQRAGGTAAAGISGLVLNSPWFDLQGPAYVRTVGTQLINTVGRFRAKSALPLSKSSAYGDSLHHSVAGEWDYDLDWKPRQGFPVRAGWLRAVRMGQARLHRGLDIGVPALLLRSKLTRFAREYGPAVDVADAVLDVAQIQRWAGCLGDRTTIVPIDGARHDVFLSAEEPRTEAFRELDSWLDWLAVYRPGAPV
ncbi:MULTISPECIES: alpha/beta hydrolase [Nocardia]|uniref:alpha/beta hydrolase n=1 Tax=Nocardia TaxID=1817 RepID=UPI002456ACC2|nr:MULTISPECIES: alpha/beta hydrolase [Nocardia]